MSKVYAFGYNRYGQLGLCDDTNRNVPIRVNLEPNTIITKISTGYFNTALVTGDRKIDLNLDDLDSSLKALSISRPERLVIFGDNSCGQLSLGDRHNRHNPRNTPFYHKVRKISLGLNHMMLVSREKKLYGVGNNHLGQLGLEGNNCHIKLENIKM